MVLIIFEGVDNLGKSTIISKLTEMYKADNDIMYMHFKNPPKFDLAIFYKSLADFIIA